MDDLEEVWGPRGRATVDPGSIRPVAPAPPSAPMPPAASGRSVAPGLPSVVGSIAAPIGEIVPAATTSPGSRPQPVAWIGAGATALVAAVLVIAMVARSSEPPAPVVATGSTATTIVSAAADLLGRSRTATASTDGTGATATTAAPDSAVVTAPPSSSVPPPPPTVGGVTPTSPRPTTAPVSSADRPPLALAEETARHFIEVVSRRDCDGLWNLLSRGTQSFLTGSAEPGEPSGREALCEGLRSEETIPPMRVHGPAVAQGDRAAVPLESEGEVEELHFVAEDGRWVIDLFGDFAEES